MKTFLTAIALAAATAVSAAPVGIGAAAGFDTLGFRLIDLTQNDNKAASVKFRKDDHDILVQSTLYARGESELYDFKWLSTTGSGATGLVTTGASTAAMISGGPSFAALAMGQSLRGSTRFDGYVSYVGLAMDLTLGAGSAIEWVGNYAVSAWATGPGSQFDKSFAHVTFGGIENSFSVGAQAWGTGFDALSGTATYRIENLTGKKFDTSAYFKAVVAGGQVAPIPEPSTWVLTLAGLLAVGIVVGRRNG